MLFLSVDVNRILNIPLAFGMREDSVSWDYTNEESFQFDRGITNMAESWSDIMDKNIRNW
jgi:hypothetical protein